jgi:hypothetical protein
MLAIHVTHLLVGFVNNFNSLLLPAEKWADPTQEQHAIVEYFRRLGLALGYAPWCVVHPYALEWYGEPAGQVVLRLVIANDATSFGDTLHQLGEDSQATLRLGFVWAPTGYTPSSADQAWLASCSAQQLCELLLIVRSDAEEEESVESLGGTRVWRYPVKAWHAVNGTCRLLADYEWDILSPEDWGFQTAYWKQRHPTV